MGAPKLIMCIGIVGSGKSTHSHVLAEEYSATIFSSDELRAELYGDVNDQTHNQELFTELHRRIKECLKFGESCIYDACNISFKQRKAFLQELKNIPCEKTCVVMATPYEECLRRNAARERKVPEHVIKRMYMNFEIPYYYEGWDNIWIRYSEGSKDSFGLAKDFIERTIDFSQDNPHHALTLGQHCREVARTIFGNTHLKDHPHADELVYAGMLHDESKVFCKTFIDSKGNPSETAHYYGHHCCSAYDSLFYKFAVDHLYVAVLIQWHMQMHFNKEQKTKDKWRKLWGEELYKDLCILHEADLEAH